MGESNICSVSPAAEAVGREVENRPSMDEEKRSINRPSTSYSSSSTTDAHTDSMPYYAPVIGRNQTNNTSNSIRATASRRSSLSRTRSQNGFGVEDLETGSTGEDASAEDAAQRMASKDLYEVRWENGDKDPMNPRSMSTARKWIITGIVSFGSLSVTCASSIYVSTYTQMEAEFGNERMMSTLGLSFFVLGIAFGPAFLGPLSEFYGRRPIYIASFALFVIWLIPEAVAKNIRTIIAGRMFDGLAGSAFLSVSGGTVGDMFTQEKLAAPMMLFSLAPFLGPSIGPLIGGFINSNVYWRWTYYVLLIWAALLLVAIFFFVPETYHPVVLMNKARAFRKSTGDSRWKAPMEKTNKSIVRTIGRSLLRPIQMLVFESMVLLLCIYTAVLLGILYLFFGAFPLVFRTNHGFTLWQVGLTFLGIFVGMILGAATDPIWGRIRNQLIAKKEAETGEVGSEPEFRLPVAIAGGFLVPVGVFWFAWTTMPEVHWIVPIIGSAFFGAGTLLVFTGVFTFLVDAYPLYAASALSANALVRCSFAAIFPLFGEQMYKRLGYQWATSVLGFLTLVMMPFPYIFFRYGKKIRGRTDNPRAARHEQVLRLEQDVGSDAAAAAQSNLCFSWF
ncbi:Efflux pump atB [Zalerion maritima]|uniref:Efflux pump atB n=1 Tax=Zalerion maritima TaxID=339359 RepID=A0AAD5RPR2_9PEZI|nr:Efflux pump atB [Zalerion maritima]